MKPDTIYEERIVAKWAKIVLPVAAVALISVLVYQLLAGPIGAPPAITWIFLGIFLLLLAVAVNFATLTIEITPRRISVGHGVIKRVMALENVADCYPDTASGGRYGGRGIRLGRVRGGWRLVYNVIGGPRVVLVFREGKIREFVFCTGDAEEVVRVVKQQIGKMAV